MEQRLGTVDCPQCGHANRPGVDDFCPRCSYPVFWDQHGDRLPGDQAPDPDGGGWLPSEGPSPASGSSPAPGSSPTPPSGPPQGQEVLRIKVETTELTLAPGHAEALVTVQVSNVGPTVEEFVVELPGAPDWLDVTPAEVRLLPGTAEEVGLRLRPLAGDPVTAGDQHLSVRVRSALRPDAVRTAPLTIVVPGQEGQLTLTAEPQVLRGGGSGRLTLTASHTGNAPLGVDLRGSDAEGAATFSIRPPALELPAYGSANATAHVSAPRPFRGETVSRSLTLSASAGSRQTSATATLIQEPLVTEGVLTAMRVLLTLLGGLLMLGGALATWTTAPATGRGVDWTYDAYAAIAFNVDLLSTDELGIAVPSALVSAAAVVAALAVLTLLGLLGPAGRLTRFASGLALLFVLAFLAILFVSVGVGVGGGAWTVILGSLMAFTGGLLARR